MALPLFAIAGIATVIALLVGQKNLIASAYSTTKAALYRIPNSIFQIIESTCNESWTVYARTAREPAAGVVVALVTFGLDDVIRGAARPKYARGDPHTRRGGKSGRKGGGIPEVGELVGKNIPGATTLKGRAITSPEGFLWTVDSAIQRVAWNWFVIQLVDEFTYEWASAILESEAFCDPERPTWRREVDFPYETSSINPWQDFPFKYSVPTWSSGGATINLDGRSGYTISSIQMRNTSSSDCRYKHVIRLFKSLTVIYEVSREFDIGVDEVASSVIGATIQNGVINIAYRIEKIEPIGITVDKEFLSGTALWGATGI